MFDFFFQAEDGIRDYDVTGVQTCALPIYKQYMVVSERRASEWVHVVYTVDVVLKRLRMYIKIGRASCRERV